MANAVLLFMGVLATLLIVVTSSDSLLRWSEEKVLKFYTAKSDLNIVAGPGSSTNNPAEMAFGSLVVFDRELREGPDASSKYLGQGRGLVVVDKLSGTSVLNILTCDFTNDMYNGSISFSGTENLLEYARTVPITGGTGDFLLVKGYLISSSDLLDPKSPGEYIEVHYVQAKSLADYVSI